MVDLSARFVNLPADKVDTAIEGAQRAFCRGFHLDRSTLWQCDREPGRLLLTHYFVAATGSDILTPPGPEVLTDASWVLRSKDRPPAYAKTDASAFFPWCYKKVCQGQTLAISRLSDIPPEGAIDKELLTKYGTLSTVLIPLIVGKDFLGCLTFASTTREREWTEITIKRFQMIAHLFANALARKIADLALRASESRLRAILDTADEGILTLNSSHEIETANAGAWRIFGYPPQGLIGLHVHSLLPQAFVGAYESSMAAHLDGAQPQVIGAHCELVGQRKDGTLFPLEISHSQTMLGMQRISTLFVRDITVRKKAEQTLRESESRFRTLADNAPVFIWSATPDRQCAFFNKPWLDFRGRTLADELGDGWQEGIHADDLPGLLKNIEESFESRQPLVAQFRVRRHDSLYRWVAAHGVPRHDEQNRFDGYIGSCSDITERMQVEQAARDLSGLLINAQEEERARLARELHDDITQRLARLAIDVGRIENASVSSGTADRLAAGVRETLVRLSDDVHALSHSLHPSVLIDLGLVDALKAESENLITRFLIPVDVKVRDLPPAVPRNVAIALFRIAQEALRNAVKHGHATEIIISLRGLDGGLQLAVQDNGIGFNPRQHRVRPSLGLASMAERVRFLGGELDIDSEPGHGTTVVAWTPIMEGTL